jgi:hypothetical protein
VERKSVVYADWKRNGDANPIAFSSLNGSLLRQIQAKNVITARKFPKGSIHTDEWERLVLERKTTTQDSAENPATKRQRINPSLLDIS